MTSIYDWSLNAAANANADAQINWAEGQPPSSVNDSARVMMQRIAQYLADQSGVLMAGGTADALALDLNVPVESYQDGIRVRFRGLFANQASVTLNVNNLGGRAVFVMRHDGLRLLAGGEIQPDGIYDVIYVQTLAGGAGGWLLLTPTQTQSIPAGLIASFACERAPTGWLECDGAEVSREDYANLFAVIGTIWGAGDGATSFTLPDLRAQFLRGWDHGRGLDDGRVFASDQSSANKAHNHGGLTSMGGSHMHGFSIINFNPVNVAAGGIASAQAGQIEEERITQVAGSHQHQISSDGDGESRPRNSAILYAIKF